MRYLFSAIEMDGEHTPPACGFRRLAETMVPSGKVSGAPPDTARGPRALPALNRYPMSGEARRVWRVERRGRGSGRVVFRSRRTRGFSLIECIVYVAALVVILGLALMAFYRTDENTRHLARNAADITRTVNIGELWRTDVRKSTGKLQLTQLGADQELRIPQGNGEIGYAFRESTVWRRADAQAPWVALLAHVKSSNMFADARQQVTAWRWEVELLSTQKVVRVPPLFSFATVAPNPAKP